MQRFVAEVFTSPTPDKILEAIKAVDTGDGVLLVVKNYAGDVMNFEMAQELRNGRYKCSNCYCS